jgi:hypothetical protein
MSKIHGFGEIVAIERVGFGCDVICEMAIDLKKMNK